MYECHHGSHNSYARKVWEWDDGNGIPENSEITWPTSLQTSDVDQLDNSYPALTFLRSCLCGKPEAHGLGAYLLYRGAANVISSSRVCWYTPADSGGIPHHLFSGLFKDTTASQGIIGKAYDIGRTKLMDASGFWIIAYIYNLFGDPAIRQCGRPATEKEVVYKRPVFPQLSIYPNPASDKVTIHLQTFNRRKINLDIYNECGRLVKKCYEGYIESNSIRLVTGLSAGIYFFVMKAGAFSSVQKVVFCK
jgi:hypothetical protein